MLRKVIVASAALAVCMYIVTVTFRKIAKKSPKNALDQLRKSACSLNNAGSMSKDNNIKQVVGLRNTYLALRHGESIANVNKIVCSQVTTACDPALSGLTELGRSQAADAAIALSHFMKQCADSSDVSASASMNLQDIIVLSSDFSRALETAEIVAKKLRVRPQNVQTRLELRERDFGSYEGKHSETSYPLVWSDDFQNPWHTFRGVESVVSVYNRTIGLILDCEEKYAQCIIVLTAHGDTLQILQSAFDGVDPRHHRSLPHLRNAELRPLILAPSLTSEQEVL